jgi:hypothetical protein
MRRFDPAPRLQHFLNNLEQLIKVDFHGICGRPKLIDYRPNAPGQKIFAKSDGSCDCSEGHPILILRLNAFLEREQTINLFLWPKSATSKVAVGC